MTVGSLLHVGIEPVVGAIVGPGDHITFLQQVVLVGLAAQGAVHDNTGLSAGDVGVGTIGAVPKTLDQAGIHGRLNVTRAPQILRDIGEIALVVLHLGLEEADGHLGELAAGDLGIGAESTVLIAVDDSHAAQCGDIQVDMLQQKDTAIATDKKEYIKKLTGARVLNYDDRHEAVIDRIEGTLVHVSGEKYWNQKPVYEFLGHFKFLSTEDARNFYKAFGSEINAHKAKIAEDERVRQSQSSRLDYSKLYGPSSFWEDEEQNTPDYDEDTDSGPDGVVETYEEYNSYD